MTSEEKEFWRRAAAAKEEIESWPPWKRAAAARARVTPRPDADFIESVRKRVESWPAWKRRAAAAGLFAKPLVEERGNMDSELWSLEEEKKTYWGAYSDNWEARIEHDGNDGWTWWVAIKNGEYIAEGYVPGSDLEDFEDPHKNEGLTQAKALAWAVLKQVDTWTDVLE